jgi:hypothetical protein
MAVRAAIATRIVTLTIVEQIGMIEAAVSGTVMNHPIAGPPVSIGVVVIPSVKNRFSGKSSANANRLRRDKTGSIKQARSPVTNNN